MDDVCCNKCGGDILIGPALCVGCTASLRAECDALRREVEVLRRYGNKTCTAMADEELAKRESGLDPDA